MSKNTLILFASDGITVRQTFHNVYNFHVSGNEISFNVGEDTRYAAHPTDRPLDAGHPNINCDTLVIGREYSTNSIHQYFKDP